MKLHGVALSSYSVAAHGRHRNTVTVSPLTKWATKSTLELVAVAVWDGSPSSRYAIADVGWMPANGTSNVAADQTPT